MIACARCGHPLDLHGRRGHGACRHGRVSPLALAVEVVRAGVLAGASGPAISASVDEAFALAQDLEPCTCKRFAKTARGRSA